jgi:protein ImuB
MKELSRRYLSLWLRRLPTDRIARRLSAPAEAPFVLVAPVKSALRISALNDVAARLGLKTGMALADARAMYPALAAGDADREADLALLAAVADWCERYTPLVGLDAPDGLLLDITGCAYLFGGEAALVRDVVERLARQGLQARAAVADTVGGAWAMARYGDFSANLSPVIPGRAPLAREPGIQKQAPRSPLDSGSRAYACRSSAKPVIGYARVRNGEEEIFCIVPRGETEVAVRPLPLAALRLDAETVAALAQAGLKRIADVLERPRAPLAARFGENFIRRLDRALGREDEPITPRLPLPAAMAERRFPDPIAREADVLGTIEQLARELDRVLERRGEGARLLQVALFRADGTVHRIELGTAAPLRDAARVRRLFADRLAVLGDACDPGFGFDMLRLSALVTERLDPMQVGVNGGDEAAQAAELAHLIDRLGARFGLRRVCRLMPQNTHIPEFAAAAMPAHAASSFEARLRRAPQDDDQADSLSPARPIRLFQRPEPIEAMAEVPDGPPVRFRWRRVLHEVAAAEGPERIAMEWWRDEAGRALTRDYFRVESRHGARVWLYREGLYGRETPQPRWFLHGLFG